MIRRPPRSTPLYSSAASDVYKRQLFAAFLWKVPQCFYSTTTLFRISRTIVLGSLKLPACLILLAVPNKLLARQSSFFCTDHVLLADNQYLKYQPGSFFFHSEIFLRDRVL